MNRLVCQFKLPSSLAKNLFLVLLSGASDPRMAFLVPQLVSPHAVHLATPSLTFPAPLFPTDLEHVSVASKFQNSI